MVKIITDYFLEHAKALSDIKAILSNKEDVIEEHLAKLYFWRNENAHNHWEGEIFGNVPRLPVLKGSKKLASKRTILDYLYSYSEVIQRQTKFILQYIELKEPDLPSVYKHLTSKDCYNFKCFCDTFFNFVADGLSTVGGIDKDETYNLLETLLNKYPLYLNNKN